MKNEITIIGKSIEVYFYLENMEIKIKHGLKIWESDQLISPYIKLNHNGISHTIYFKEAARVQHELWQRGIGEGVKSIYSDFYINGDILPLELETLVWIDNYSDDLHFELIPLVEKDGIRIEKICWPSPFKFDQRQNSNYTVIPMRQGVLIPNNWSDEVELVYEGRYYSMGFYMPWWGQIENRAGYMAIIETPWDAGCDVIHPSGGPTRIAPVWFSSLGSLNYKRKARYTFLQHCDYNDLCKRYRNYIKQQGKLVTLREKIIKNPTVKYLIGTNIVHDYVYYHIKQESIYYNKDAPEKNDQMVSFRERALQLKMLKEKGAERVYFHLDGWGKRGYDNLHPDILPPCQKAGGWAGLGELIDTCKSLGYLFAIHDEYMDCYTDAESYHPQQSIHNESGEVPHDCIWYGGEQALLCTEFSVHYLKRNIASLYSNGAKIDGIYLDIFSAAPLNECFHMEHRMSRRECVERRRECFEYSRSEGMIVSSEECADWAIPSLDLVHHAPYPLTPKFDYGKCRGIPVPLFNIVYHDCLIVPWLTQKGIWGIPESDDGFLHALLNGGVPYLSILADESEIRKNWVICELHKKVGLSELVKHEFIEGDLRRQRTFFSDGTEIYVNFDTMEYNIK